MIDVLSFTSEAETLRARIDALIERVVRIGDIEAVEAAACRGGFDGYGSASDISGRAKFARQCCVDEAKAVIAEHRGRFDELLEQAFSLDLKAAADLAPLLQARLTDADLRSLAKSNVTYAGLSLIAGRPDSKFAAELGRRLDALRSEIEGQIARLLRLAEGAVREPRADSVFNSRALWPAPVSMFTDNVQAAAERLDAFVCGDESADVENDPLFAAVLRHGGR